MAELIQRIRRAYIGHLLLLVLAVIACNTSEHNNNDYIDAGKNYYDKTCLSCHLRGNNTLYQPSLEQMSKYEKATISELLLKLKSDSVHLQLLPIKYNTDSLISFIKSYKKQDIIPYKTAIRDVRLRHPEIQIKGISDTIM
jgi:hypothetical protein